MHQKIRREISGGVFRTIFDPRFHLVVDIRNFEPFVTRVTEMNATVKFLLISYLSISYEYDVPIIEKDNVENQLQDANSTQFETIATALIASLEEAQQNPDIASDFIVPESLETLPSSDPTIMEIIDMIIIESENQKSSSIFEVIVAQPITFEVAISELGGNREEIEQEEIEKWAEEKLRSFLTNMTLRSGLN